MEEAFWLFFCGCVGFISGYGVRAMISLRHRRELLKMREAHKVLMEAKAVKTSNRGESLPHTGG
jgi:hypothetical protein